MDYSALLKILNPDDEANATPVPSDNSVVPDPTANLSPLATQAGAQTGLMSSDDPTPSLSMTAEVPPSMIKKAPAAVSAADPSDSQGDAGGSGNGNGSDVADFIAKKYGFNPLMDAKALSNAQSLQNDQQLTANLGQAFDKIGSSIARTSESPEAQKFYQNLQEQAKNPVKDIIQQRQAAQQGQQFAQEQENADPNSNRAAMLRKMAGPIAQKGGVTLAPGMSVNDIEGAKSFIEQGAKLKQQEQIASDNRDLRSELAKGRNDALKGAAEGKDNEKTTKRFTTFGESIDENKARAGEFGRQAQFVNNADRILVLAHQFPDGNIPKAQMSELAVSTANLLGGGNGAAAETVNRFVPHTLSGSAAGITEWLTSKPTGTGQQAFAKMMFDTANREKDLASNKINGIKMSRVAQFGDLQKKDPELFNSILESHGVDPEVYSKYKQGGYKMPASTPTAAPGPAADQSGLEAEMRKRGLLK